MELLKQNIFKIILFFFIYWPLNATSKEIDKNVGIYYLPGHCDFTGSINFEAIKLVNTYESEPRCIDYKVIKDSTLFNNIMDILKNDSLVIDSISYKAYGFNLIFCIDLITNEGVVQEFGIDYKGTIFYNNKLYYPSERLKRLICSNVSSYKCK